MNPKHVLVIDVESVGLHGQACQVAGVMVELDGEGGMEELGSFKYAVDPRRCLGTGPDLQWVMANVPQPEHYRDDSPERLMDAFWAEWRLLREHYPGIIMAAECAWPVEARFLAACVDRRRSTRTEVGPYPLHDIASIMLAAGMDPLAAYDRRPEELPRHCPLADARQSARLMHEALCRLDGWRCPPPLDLRQCAAEQLEREAAMIPQLEQEQQAEPKPPLAVEPVDEVTAGIIQQIYEALTALGADSKLLGVVGSWRDTLPDLHVLAGLRAWNAQRGAPPSMEQREPERQRGLLTKQEWAMVDRAGGLISQEQGGQAS